MFEATIDFPEDASTVSLVRIDDSKPYESEYLYKNGSTSEVRFRIRHSKVKAKNGEPQKDRHNVEVVERFYATETQVSFEEKVYWVAEKLPQTVDTKREKGLCEWLISSGVLGRLLGWES